MENEPKDLVISETNPKEIADFGRKAAGVLKDIVSQAKLIKNISGNDYMMFEGWQTVARFFKTQAGIEWTKQVLDADGNIAGFEARAYVQDEAGKILSTAESYCGKDEHTWKSRPTFAIRSMAQTRACSKALRQVYSWVVVLAGYKPTPAEEMDGVVVEKPKNVTPTQTAKPENMNCSAPDCGAKLTQKVYDYSTQQFQTPLCFKHQKELREIKEAQSKDQE